MAGRPKNQLDQEVKSWLLTTAWKKMTLQEIAVYSRLSVTVIKRLYDEYDIKPITRRDRIASKILDVYNGSEPFPTNNQLAEMYNCSVILIKSILQEHSLVGTTATKKGAIKKQKEAGTTAQQVNANAYEEYKKRCEAMTFARKAFTSYTQSGSDLTDHVRQISTTYRPSTYLTNNE